MPNLKMPNFKNALFEKCSNRMKTFSKYIKFKIGKKIKKYIKIRKKHKKLE